VKRLLFHLIVGACALAVAVAPVAADTLPAQLSDEEFWRLMMELSEPGPFPSVLSFFISNEITFQRVIPALKQTAKPDGTYLGTGPEQNFTYIAALQPKIAFIIDSRRQNMVEHFLYKALFELSTDRADFISRLFSRPRPSGSTGASTPDALFSAMTTSVPRPQLFAETLAAVKRCLIETHRMALTAAEWQGVETMLGAFRDQGPSIDWTTGSRMGGRDLSRTYAALMTAADEKGGQWSYLATEENFRRVQDLERRNLIVPVVGDFGGTKTLQAVGAYLKQHGAIVGAFYTSSVEEFMRFRQGYVVPPYTRFCESVATLPIDATSTFIRSSSVTAQWTVLASMTDFIRAFKEGRQAPPGARGARPQELAQTSCR
jgi:hypothetical protein